jgi:hypothetical protein
MRLNKFAELLEGGVAVSDASRIKKEQIAPTLKEFKKQVLDKIGIKDFEPIGSTGKKAESGDVDIAVELPTDMDHKEVYKRVDALGLERSKSISPTIMSIKFPIYDEEGKTDKFAQIDMMFGKREWLKFGYWAPEEGTSKYSGLYRNILLAAIIRYARELKGKPGKTWAIDLSKGITRKTRETIITKKGEPKEVVAAKTFITDDPEKLVKLLNAATKGGWKKEDFTSSFEDLWKKTKEVFSKDKLDKIKEYVQQAAANTKREIPIMEKLT